ncbi:MAG: hypothetical protein ACOY0R_21000 [Chloroflexota bacterium]
MNPSDLLRRFQTLPVLLLILVNVIVGLFTFRDYGYSIDEPFFYGYADAIGYAYNPANWFSGDFDLEANAYGPSAWDHRNRGPAYLLFTRGPAHLLQAIGLDQASAWHLVNFLSYQVAVYFFFVLARRWLGTWAAFFATLLFSTQPVLWEHAFINPKDPSFLLFFLLSLEFGLRMADQLANAPTDERPLRTLGRVVLPGILLGLTTSIRILGPLAAVLVGLYYLLLKKPRRILWFIPYGLVALLAMYVSWPYLWENPIQNFLGTLNFMADNPTTLRVLFNGELYRADQLPTRYLPMMMLLTLTEPVWPLAAVGGIFAILRARRRDIEWKSLLAAFLWLALPMAYVLGMRPPMYDGFRHFLFIVPPLFILAGLGADALFRWAASLRLQGLLALVLLLPGLYAGLSLHPYQYTYYNLYAGGTREAAYRFETDYWLTCYKDAMGWLNQNVTEGRIVFVNREGYIAAYYARQGLEVVDLSRRSTLQAQTGDYLLQTSRADPGIRKAREDPAAILIERQNAIFCAIRPYP